MSLVPGSRFLLIASISLATICFQLLITKVLAFVFWNHIVYLVISIALLGYGAASTLIAVREKEVLALPPGLFLGANMLLFAVSALFGLFYLRSLGLTPENILPLGLLHIAISALPLLAAYFLFFLPFFFSGNVVVYLFFIHPQTASRLYFYDLVGAAVGCLLFVPLISGTGAVGGILICTLLATLWSAALLKPHSDHRRGRQLLAVAAVLSLAILAVFPVRDRAFKLRVDTSKVLGGVLAADAGIEPEYSAWDVVTRLDVVSNDESDIQLGWTTITPNTKLVTFDGDAISHIPSRSSTFPDASDLEKFRRTSYYVPLLGNTIGGDHLLIGLGGGPDISTSLLLEARTMTGVEINGALIQALRTTFAEFGGNVFNRDNVRIVHSEGRGFLHREKRDYDLIFISGTDTFTALSTGAYVLAENFLYTSDALRDYYRHLTDDGTLFVLRWFFHDRPRESLRLFSTALEALREEGVAEPERHVLVVRVMWRPGFSPGIILVRKQPYTDNEARELLATLNEKHKSIKPVYFPIPRGDWNDTFIPESRFYAELQQAFARGDEDDFYDAYEYDVEPVPDDRPFFFKYYKFSTMLKGSWDAVSRTGPIHGYWGYLVFLIILAVAAMAVFVFIWLPLWRFKRAGVRAGGSVWATLYFTALGLGFIMLEITLMQKFALFLGHPMYSISTVLAGMLFFAGVGSWIAERWDARPVRGITLAFAGVAVMVAFFVFLSGPVSSGLLGLGLAGRITVAVVMISPLAMALGFFFPLGLTLIERRDARYIPWAWGVNSGFTVIGSILSIMIAMVTGFSAVFVLAAVIYAAGVLAIRRYEVATASPSSPTA